MRLQRRRRGAEEAAGGARGDGPVEIRDGEAGEIRKNRDRLQLPDLALRIGQPLLELLNLRFRQVLRNASLGSLSPQPLRLRLRKPRPALRRGRRLYPVVDCPGGLFHDRRHEALAVGGLVLQRHLEGA